jgi:AraC family ethanolamine operon transcriptional activator
MTTRASAGSIETNDVEELQQIVQPWEVVLRQISSGRLHARMDYVQINGIVLYREYWSRRILATGATPAGFFFFGGPTLPKLDVGWCGTELGTGCLAFGHPSSEIDFATPDAEEHVCLLVSDDLMRRYLGEEFVVRGLPSEHFLACARGCGAQLLHTMERILDKYFVHRNLLANERACQAIEWQLMGGLVEFLLTRREPSTAGCTPRAARHQLVRRAIELCEAASQPIGVSDLAAACNVSKRVLELGFRETLQTTPSRFIRLSRMNRVRKDLRTSDRASDSVTNIAIRRGVTELGRFAVEYKSLFGESPSATLRRGIGLPGGRLADVLPRT